MEDALVVSNFGFLAIVGELSRMRAVWDRRGDRNRRRMWVVAVFALDGWHDAKVSRIGPPSMHCEL